MTKTETPGTDMDELRYRGILGHTIVVLTDDRGSLETCDMAGARKYAAEHAEHRPRIYKKTKRGWKAVRS